jgi:hypothetical protein
MFAHLPMNGSVFQFNSPEAVRLLAGCPPWEVCGNSIAIQFRPRLSAYRGRLLSGDQRGEPVHAASHMPRREIVLDSALLRSPGELRRIFIHEAAHFVWVRLGNPRRWEYEELLQAEFQLRAQGELGWSAEGRKQALTVQDRERRSRHWREYVCESFCDSAAWLWCGVDRHSEFRLTDKFRRLRRAWLNVHLAGRIVPV